MFRRTTLRSLGVLTVALAGCTGGNRTPTDEPVMTDGGTAADGPMTLTSPAFGDGEPIPTEYTCDGADRSPELAIGDVPDDVAAFALLVDDPDAPSAEPFVHWVLYDVPGEVRTIPAGVPQGKRVDALDGAKQGQNGFGDLGYGGPCPPQGDGPHTYRFRLFGLSSSTGLDPGASRDDLLAAVDGKAVARALLTGEYERA